MTIQSCGQPNLDTLINKATKHFEAGEYNEAIDPLEQVVEETSKLYGKGSVEYATYIYYLGICNEMLGNYHSAVECFNNLADSYSKLYEETGNLNFRLGYAIALTSVSLQHDYIAEYEIAIDCQLKGLEIIHELLGEND
jgi:tetratricopeptide (TPR) repeat protein